MLFLSSVLIRPLTQDVGKVRISQENMKEAGENKPFFGFPLIGWNNERDIFWVVLKCSWIFRTYSQFPFHFKESKEKRGHHFSLRCNSIDTCQEKFILSRFADKADKGCNPSTPTMSTFRLYWWIPARSQGYLSEVREGRAWVAWECRKKRDPGDDFQFITNLSLEIFFLCYSSYKESRAHRLGALFWN